jgi:serpin B
MKTIVTLLCVCLLQPGVAMAEGLRTTDADKESVVRGNNAFAVGLYSQLKSQPGNLFFSPESISTALAMTYAGARGETAAEMANVLHFTLPPDQLHPAIGTLLRERNGAHDGYTLKEADALWGQKDYIFLGDYLKLTKENYNAATYGVDFKEAAEASRQIINQWVEQQTENKIQNVIGQGGLNEHTRLVLTNAIYFKGDWQAQFDKRRTKNEDFHVSAAQTVNVPLMHRTDNFNYLDGGTFQALEIPYKNKELSMIVFLPKAVDGLSDFEQSLSPISMVQWLGQLKPASEVIVAMPKFKMESQFGLKNTLAAMGMGQAFDPKQADFSGIAPKEVMQRDGNLYINAVIHKAYVDVNEEGTEAAAATAISAKRVVTTQPVFRANHPFLFLICENHSGSIIFIGRLIDPTK